MADDISDGVELSELEINSDLESKLNRYYYTQDEQGSIIYITDNHKNIRNEYCYDAWGNILDSKEEVHNRITYTGQQFDNITQQYYLRARFYNLIVGRFTQEDVYRGDGLNLYAYCKGNPVVYYDPSGFAKVQYHDKLFQNNNLPMPIGESSSEKLAYNMLKHMGLSDDKIKGQKTGSHQAQHVIPQDVFDKSKFLQEIGFQVDHHQNGIWDINKDMNTTYLADLLDDNKVSDKIIERYVSDNTHHQGYHKLYSKEVGSKVKDIELEMKRYKKDLQASGKYSEVEIEKLYTRKARKEVHTLTENLRSVNKNGVDMYANHWSNETNWNKFKKDKQEKYGEYFENKMSCAGKGRSSK